MHSRTCFHQVEDLWGPGFQQSLQAASLWCCCWRIAPSGGGKCPQTLTACPACCHQAPVPATKSLSLVCPAWKKTLMWKVLYMDVVKFRQAGRHSWLYHTSKQSASSQMTLHDSNALLHWWHLTQHATWDQTLSLVNSIHIQSILCEIDMKPYCWVTSNLEPACGGKPSGMHSESSLWPSQDMLFQHRVLQWHRNDTTAFNLVFFSIIKRLRLDNSLLIRSDEARSLMPITALIDIFVYIIVPFSIFLNFKCMAL